MGPLYLSFGGKNTQFGSVVAEKTETQNFVTYIHTHTHTHTHTQTPTFSDLVELSRMVYDHSTQLDEIGKCRCLCVCMCVCVCVYVCNEILCLSFLSNH